MPTKTKKESSPDEEGVKRHRVQLDFSPEAYERLNRIRTRFDAATSAEVVRNALRLYDGFLEQTSKGAKFQIVDNGDVKEIEFFF